MLRPGETLKPCRRSSSAVIHVIESEGYALIGGVDLTLAVERYVRDTDAAKVAIVNRSEMKPALLFQIDDAPMQRKLGFFEKF
jgi:gentisate 1,2-dioxygenase